ncbi:rod shape-determining protein MreC [Staphylococcus sp. NRL 19/737]|nr:rod shape-determining protein MreC [Staphylococcus sp. NRL 19/737]
MQKFFKNNKLIVVFCAIIIFIALIGLSIRSQTQSPPEQYVGDSVSFGQRVISYPVNFVTGAINNIFSSSKTTDNKKISKLEAKNEKLEAENKDLKKELHMSDISKYDAISGAVIARNPDQWMNTVIIDKGKKAGVGNNMAVMTADGLIGRITKVNQFSSQVDLLSTNTRTGKLSVNIQHGSSNVFGLIDHYDKKSQELIISNVNNKDKISKGDKVVTSGLADQLPSDLYIGEVTKVENDEYGLAKEVRVKTGANLSQVNHVYIAKRDAKSAPEESGE